MRADDQLTSGYCWFDYAREVCRIDGLFNPWPEKEKGYQLWMSEVGDVARGQSLQKKLAYRRGARPAGEGFFEDLLAEELSPFHALFLPRTVLRDGPARHSGWAPVLGQRADVWTLDRPNKAPWRFYLRAGTNLLLRMESGNDPRHVSVRDFHNLSIEELPESIFAMKRTTAPLA